jgi:hypothetical protein
LGPRESHLIGEEAVQALGLRADDGQLYFVEFRATARG